MMMDEPLTGLDAPSQADILSLLDVLKSQGVTVMVATHDLEQAAKYFDRIMLLNHRLIGFGNPDEVLQPEMLIQAYGGRLRKAEDGETMTIDDSCCSEEHDHVH